MKRIFVVKGMKCAACQAHVTRAVTALPIVKNAEVNLLTGIMSVEYEDAEDGAGQIVDAVVKSGFKAQPIDEDKPYGLPADESDKLFRQFIVSLVTLAVLVCVKLIPFPGGNSMPLDSGCACRAALQFILTLVIVYANRDYFKSGFTRLIRFSPDMNSLIAIGSGAALLYSVPVFLGIVARCVFNHEPDTLPDLYNRLYFDSAAMILTLVTLGKYLEAKAKRRTTDAISKLIRLVPQTATIVRKGQEAEIPAAALMPGDIVLVRPGASVPADGIITEGTGLLDESAITGESVPVGRETGDRVTGGTTNRSGAFNFRVEHAGKGTTLAAIIQLVENASNSKAPVSRMADRISLFFVPVVILLALAAGTIWGIHGESFAFCLKTTIAVLVVSCPCALGLATPVAIMVATGVGSRNGILIRNAVALEALAKVRTVALDKTGTVTAGKHQVVYLHDIASHTDEQRKDLLARIAALESRSEHPFGHAIVEYAAKLAIPFATVPVRDFNSLPGFGVSGVAGEGQLVCGNARMMEKSGIPCGAFQKEQIPSEYRNCSAMYVADAGTRQLLAVFLLEDTVLEDTEHAIALMRRLKLNPVLLTGDSRSAADTVAARLGIAEVHAEMTPDAKAAFVQGLRENGKHGVAMVGDGINDAAALASADVGIAIGSGTDIAIETADVVLAKNSLNDACSAIQLGRSTMRTIRINLFWALFYNVLCIPIAGGALYPAFGLQLHPAVCAAAMACSSIFVVTNALRLRKFRPHQ